MKILYWNSNSQKSATSLVCSCYRVISVKQAMIANSRNTAFKYCRRYVKTKKCEPDLRVKFEGQPNYQKSTIKLVTQTNKSQTDQKLSTGEIDRNMPHDCPKMFVIIYIHDLHMKNIKSKRLRNKVCKHLPYCCPMT